MKRRTWLVPFQMDQNNERNCIDERERETTQFRSAKTNISVTHLLSAWRLLLSAWMLSKVTNI